MVPFITNMASISSPQWNLYGKHVYSPLSSIWQAYPVPMMTKMASILSHPLYIRRSKVDLRSPSVEWVCGSVQSRNSEVQPKEALVKALVSLTKVSFMVQYLYNKNTLNTLRPFQFLSKIKQFLPPPYFSYERIQNLFILKDYFNQIVNFIKAILFIFANLRY